jgi:hypothetical protein
MVRAKDLANYSAEDKSAIFGGVPYDGAVAPTQVKAQTAEESKAQEIGSESEVCCSHRLAASVAHALIPYPQEMEEEEKEKKKVEDKGEEEEDKQVDLNSGVTTTTSAVSMQEYFKMRMGTAVSL